MSTEETSYVSVLLPAASVALFSRDPQSVEAFEKLAQDWRFPRVELTVYEGGVAEAAAMFEKERSPQLVIIQTETIDETFTQQLEGLSAHCAEGTSAIVVGPVNDVNLYRRLVGMGVTDYLVKPLQSETLANDIAASLIEQMGASGSRLIAMIGSKGGTGTTVLSEALAWGTAEKLGQKTFLLDAAAGWSTLSIGMNFEPATTLFEAARAATEGNKDSLSRMMHTPHEKLTVLSSGGDSMLEDNIALENYEALLDHIMIAHPVVIVDLSGASNLLKHVVLARAHQTIIVMTPTLPAVRASRTLMQEIKDIRGGNAGNIDLVLNKQGFAPKGELTKAQIEEGLERKLSAALPFVSEALVYHESEGKKISEAKEGIEITNQLLPIMRKLLNLTTAEDEEKAEGGKKSSGLGGLFKKTKAK